MSSPHSSRSSSPISVGSYSPKRMDTPTAFSLAGVDYEAFVEQWGLDVPPLIICEEEFEDDVIKPFNDSNESDEDDDIEEDVATSECAFEEESDSDILNDETLDDSPEINCITPNQEYEEEERLWCFRNLPTSINEEMTEGEEGDLFFTTNCNAKGFDLVIPFGDKPMCQRFDYPLTWNQDLAIGKRIGYEKISLLTYSNYHEFTDQYRFKGTEEREKMLYEATKQRVYDNKMTALSFIPPAYNAHLNKVTVTPSNKIDESPMRRSVQKRPLRLFDERPLFEPPTKRGYYVDNIYDLDIEY